MRAETRIQRDVRKYLAVKGYESVHVPNGATLSGSPKERAIQMASLKHDGLKVGFPDLIVFGRAKIGFMEIKAEAGRLSQPQTQVRDWLRRDGFNYALVRSVDDAQAALSEWGWV